MGAPVVSVPVPPTVEPEYPLWAREPAKVIGWIVTGALLVASLVTFALSPDVLAVLPDSWAPVVRAVTGTAAAVALVGGRVQAWLTRNGVGAVGNGKDGVWSPAAVQVHEQVTAAMAATPEAIEAALAPKLRPPT